MGWNCEGPDPTIPLLADCLIIKCSNSAAEIRLDADGLAFTEAQRTEWSAWSWGLCAWLRSPKSSDWMCCCGTPNDSIDWEPLIAWVGCGRWRSWDWGV